MVQLNCNVFDLSYVNGVQWSYNYVYHAIIVTTITIRLSFLSLAPAALTGGPSVLTIILVILYNIALMCSV